MNLNCYLVEGTARHAMAVTPAGSDTNHSKVWMRLGIGVQLQPSSTLRSYAHSLLDVPFRRGDAWGSASTLTMSQLWTLKRVASLRHLIRTSMNMHWDILGRIRL